MPHGRVNLEYRKHVAIVTMDRPQKRNAFDDLMFSSLEEVARQLEQKTPRVIVLTGAGDVAFCAGFDVHPKNPMNRDMLRSVEEQDETPTRNLIERIRSVVDRFTSLPVPVIAALNGQAYGGGAELATQCDLRVMDPKAIICFSEVRLGLMPDWGGSPSLVQLVGPSVAADLILTARPVDAEEAFSLKLVNRISGPGTCLDDALSLAGSIAANGPRAVRQALQVIRQAPGLTLAEGLALEARNAVSLITSGEFIYGVAAFLEKKSPDFPDLDPE